MSTNEKGAVATPTAALNSVAQRDVDYATDSLRFLYMSSRRTSPTNVTSYHAAMDSDSTQLLLSDLVFMTAHDSQYTVSTF